jgi:hypothetical protein
LFAIQTKTWVDWCDAYEQNKIVICGLIAKRRHTELSDRLETQPGHQDCTLDGPLMYLLITLEENASRRRRACIRGEVSLERTDESSRQEEHFMLI